MRGRNHLVVGLAAAMLAEGATHFVQPHTVGGFDLPAPIVLIPALGLTLVGALLPDIDLATSRIAYQTGTGRGQGCLTGLVFHWLRRLLGGHRGLTHSLWVGVAVAALCGFSFGTLTWQGRTWRCFFPGVWPAWGDLGTAFSLGYLSHLAADLVTKEGVKLWYPLSHAEVGLGPRWLRFDTGSWAEYVVVFALVVGVVWQWLSGWL